MTDLGDLDLDLDLPILRERFRDVTRWLIRDAVGDQLGAGQRDALAEEIAAVLASGLAPVLRREVEHQIEAAIAGMQRGPVSFDADHELTVAGFTVPDLVKLIDAVGRLVENGLGEADRALHETHQHMLFTAHQVWLERNELEVVSPPPSATD